MAMQTFSLRDDPAYRAADDKLLAIRARHGELQTQIDELIGHRTAAAENYRASIQSRADAVLDSDDSAVATLPPRMAEDIGVSLKVKRDQLAVLDLAVKTQEDKVAKLRQEVSERWCKENRSAYVERVRRIHAAIKELAEANDGEQEFRRNAIDAGIMFMVGLNPFYLGDEWSLKCHTGFEPRALQRLQEIERDFPELRGSIYRRRQLDVPGWS